MGGCIPLTLLVARDRRSHGITDEMAILFGGFAALEELAPATRGVWLLLPLPLCGCCFLFLEGLFILG
jgi:hypothetical protein